MPAAVLLILQQSPLPWHKKQSASAGLRSACPGMLHVPLKNSGRCGSSHRTGTVPWFCGQHLMPDGQNRMPPGLSFSIQDLFPHPEECQHPLLRPHHAARHLHIRLFLPQLPMLISRISSTTQTAIRVPQPDLLFMDHLPFLPRRYPRRRSERFIICLRCASCQIRIGHFLPISCSKCFLIPAAPSLSSGSGQILDLKFPLARRKAFLEE